MADDTACASLLEAGEQAKRGVDVRKIVLGWLDLRFMTRDSTVTLRPLVSRCLDPPLIFHGPHQSHKPTSAPALCVVRLLHDAECLTAHWFMTLADAREKLECWRRDYDEVRPHGAIGNKVPIAMLSRTDDTSPSVATEVENSSFK